jgi:hypothetical protein
MTAPQVVQSHTVLICKYAFVGADSIGGGGPLAEAIVFRDVTGEGLACQIREWEREHPGGVLVVM